MHRRGRRDPADRRCPLPTADISRPPSRSEPEVNKLFRMVMKHKGSDLHLKVGQPPMMRLRGVIRRMDMPPLTQEDMERLLFPLLTPKHRKILDEEGGVDFSHVIGKDECRFRVNLFKQRGRLSLVARRVNNSIPNFEDLGLPASHREALPLSPGAGHPRRRHRLGQEHDDRLDARLHQRARAAAHPHDRGPDRVHVHRRQGEHQPARDRHRRHRLAQGAEARRAAGPRHHPGRRDARRRDVRGRHARRRDRPPGVRHHPRRPAPPRRSAASSTCSRPTSTRPSARRWRSTSRRSSPRSWSRASRRRRACRPTRS